MFESKNLKIDDAVLEFGYATQSPVNNWSKNVPKKAEKMFMLYLDLHIERQKRLELEKKLDGHSIDRLSTLSDGAFNIAKQKCIDHGIDLKDYLSSLVVANI